MTAHSQWSASNQEATRSRRSFVRLLMGISLAAPALALSACVTGTPVPPRSYSGSNDRGDRGGGSDR